MKMNTKAMMPLMAVGAITLGACNSGSTPPATDATSTTNAVPSGGATAATGTSAAATDTFQTSAGALKVTPIHHASTLLQLGDKTIYVDPWTEGKLDGLPKADYIFISDIHPDHLDTAAIDALKKDSTVLVGPPPVSEKKTMGVVLKNGDTHDFGAFKVEAVPMYNLTRGPEAGKLFHDKGRGDGFVFTFGDKRVYFSGDTECIPEMKALQKIDVAFVCMNLPYTMPVNEAAECVKAFKPKVVFPYHYRGSNLDDFKKAVGDASEVRERSWY
jgi:L-ascorbate metabolism protein UlaG (beta-lactamase superfamily)